MGEFIKKVASETVSDPRVWKVVLEHVLDNRGLLEKVDNGAVPSVQTEGKVVNLDPAEY